MTIGSNSTYSTCLNSVNSTGFLSDFERNFTPKMNSAVSLLRLKIANRFFKRYVYESDVVYYRTRMLKTANQLAFMGEQQLRNQTLSPYLNGTCNLCSISNSFNVTSVPSARHCVDQTAAESPLMNKLGFLLQQAMQRIRYSIDVSVQAYMKSFSAYILINSTSELSNLMFSNQTIQTLSLAIRNATEATFQSCCHDERIKLLRPQNIIH